MPFTSINIAGVPLTCCNEDGTKFEVENTHIDSKIPSHVTDVRAPIRARHDVLRVIK